MAIHDPNHSHRARQQKKINQVEFLFISKEIFFSLEILSEPEFDHPIEEIDRPVTSANTSELVDNPIEMQLASAVDDLLEEDDNEFQGSDDDLHDLTSEFDNEDLFLDEFVDNNGDMEFLRSAAKNLMTSLAEMEAASTTMDSTDAPQSLLYGDDYVVTIKNRRFALAFLDYTQFRVEKQRNPDKFRLLAMLKKNANATLLKKRTDHRCDDDTPSSSIESDLIPIIETKSNKKKRNRRAKRNKNRNQEKNEPTPQSIHEEDEDDDNAVHILNDQAFPSNNFTDQRLPHVYLDHDFKPCILVTGEEHTEENEHDSGDHGDWHNIVAGGKPVPVVKKSKKKKQIVQKDDKSKVDSTEQVNRFVFSIVDLFFSVGNTTNDGETSCYSTTTFGT